MRYVREFIERRLSWKLPALLVLLGACGGSTEPEIDGDEQALAAASRAGRWTALGDDQNPESTYLLGPISLTGDPRREPVLAFSATDPVAGTDRTFIQRWSDSGWVPLDPIPGERGPSLATGDERRLYACTGGGGPYVRRWTGAAWVAVGGNISQETGYQGTRYHVDGCGGIVLDRSGAPIVVWSADVGAKANVVYAARWNKQSTRWEGLGAGSIGGRATSAFADIDARDQVYVAAYTPGGSYGGGATTRVWRWDGSSWSQLGESMPATSDPVLAVYENTAYLALQDNASSTIRVSRWRSDAWQPLPSPGLGAHPALDFSLTGKLVLAHADVDLSTRLRVQYLTGSTWHPVGSGVASETAQSISALELSVDGGGRPSVAWTEDSLTGESTLYVKRFSAALP